MTTPKLFISYSWTSPSHEAWVLEFATGLRESGVDVILDKWDLKEGNDSILFMEQMVSKDDIRKVVLICDRAYAEKTDARAGGVGTEAQIISGEIYERSDQDKFVAVVRETDDEGNAYLPTYYKGRIYIDLSDPTTYSDNFDQLLRWIFDKPLYVKPAIGKKPIFVEDSSPVALATSSRAKRAIEAIRDAKENALGLVSEYFDVLVEEFEKLRLDEYDGELTEFDDAVVASIESFLPYRNETIEVFEALARYRDGEDSRRLLHRFFERLIPYNNRPEGAGSFRDWDFDNYRFLAHELFLYCVAVLIRNERFQSADYLLENEYFVPGESEYGRDAMVPFSSIREYMKSLEHRNKRLELGRLSVRADLLNQRCNGVSVPFRDLLQADFVLFLRDNIDNPDAMWHWWPETLLYASRQSGPFEIFARSKSAKYFDEMKIVLAIESKEDLAPLLEAFKNDRKRLPRWQHESFSPKGMLGFDDLATKR